MTELDVFSLVAHIAQLRQVHMRFSVFQSGLMVCCAFYFEAARQLFTWFRLMRAGCCEHSADGSSSLFISSNFRCSSFLSAYLCILLLVGLAWGDEMSLGLGWVVGCLSGLVLVGGVSGLSQLEFTH